MALGFLTGSLGIFIISLSISTIGSYTKIRIQESEDNARKLVNALIETSAIVLFLIKILLVSPLLSIILAPGYSKEELSVVFKYIRIQSSCYIFVCIHFTLLDVHDSHKSFFVPRFETFIYSIIGILFCIIFSKPFGVQSLLIARIIAGFCFSFLLVISAIRYHKFSFVNPFRVSDIKNEYALAIPLLISISAIQINEEVDKTIASGQGDWHASSIYLQSVTKPVCKGNYY